MKKKDKIVNWWNPLIRYFLGLWGWLLWPVVAVTWSLLFPIFWLPICSYMVECMWNQRCLLSPRTTPVLPSVLFFQCIHSSYEQETWRKHYWLMCVSHASRSKGSKVVVQPSNWIRPIWKGEGEKNRFVKIH